MSIRPAPALNEAVYTRLRALVLERTGLWCGPQRRAALAAAVHKLNPDASPTAYLNQLAATPTEAPAWEALVGELAVGETYFLREPEQIEALRAQILPEIISRRRAERRLRLWSAGCATGEEPYTLAMLLPDLLPDLDAWQVRLLATDFNRQALRQAAVARYRPWSFRQMPPLWRQRFFVERDGLFELEPAIQRAVTFRYLNLAEAAYPSPANYTSGLDLILCRNVTIYLPEDLIRRIAARFWDSLAPGGWLLVAPGEANHALYAQFEPVSLGTVVAYRRPAEARPPAVPPAEPRPLPAPPPVPEARPPVITAPATPAEICATALKLARHRRPAEARRLLLAAPAHPGVASLLARLEADTGRPDEARRWAQQALAADPLQRDAWHVLALVSQEQGDLETAREHFRQVLYLDPDFALGHYQLALLLQRLGRPAEARRHRQQAARLAARLPAESGLEGAEGVTAGELLALTRPAGGEAE